MNIRTGWSYPYWWPPCPSLLIIVNSAEHHTTTLLRPLSAKCSFQHHGFVSPTTPSPHSRKPSLLDPVWNGLAYFPSLERRGGQRRIGRRKVCCHNTASLAMWRINWMSRRDVQLCARNQICLKNTQACRLAPWNAAIWLAKSACLLMHKNGWNVGWSLVNACVNRQLALTCYRFH